MLRNYIKIALRNLARMKFYSSINILGLSFGIAFCLIMLMFVVNELSYDSYHQKKDRIYRIALEWGEEGKRSKFGGIFPGVGAALSDQFPEVEKSLRLEKEEGAAFTVNNTEYKEDIVFFAEPSIFDIFSFTLLSGNKNELLNSPNSVVITESRAKKYFGTVDALGKTILFDKQLLIITGVIEDTPPNTHLKTDVLISYNTLKILGREAKKPWNSWGSTFTYFLLNEGYSPDAIPGKLLNLLKMNGGEFMGKSSCFVLQKLSDIHFILDFRPDIGPKGNILYIYIFLSASILILLLGCFNYVNLTSSLYMNRMSEVGVRKVFGAKRSQLIKQFLVDSLIITFISLVFGVILFEILYREIFTYLGTKVVISYSHLGYFFTIVTGIVFMVGILSGGYPALFLSKFKPVDILKKNPANFSSNFSLRKIIVVLQFTITIILLIGTFIIYRQIDFMKNSDLGYEKDNIAIISLVGLPIATNYYPVLRDELKNHTGITAVSGAFLFPGSLSSANMSVQKKNDSQGSSYFINNVMADYDYAKALGLRIIQGRDFSRNYPTDENESVLINESAAKELNLSNPVGEQLIIPYGPTENPVSITVTIIGVLKDFHLKSKHQKIAPMLVNINPNYLVMIVRMIPENVQNTIQYIRDTWKKFMPETNINIKYMDDIVAKMYISEEKISKFIAGFAILAIIISCLGLLGLTKFILSRRIKEIGIRKALGANLGSLFYLLSKQFIFWLLSANLLAWPLTYYLTNKWLQNFAYRIDFNIWSFILAGIFSFAIAFLTLNYVIIKTASTNPINSLKYE